MLSKIIKIVLPLILGAIIITFMVLEFHDKFYDFDLSITKFIVRYRGNKYGFIYFLVRILTELGNFYFYTLLFIILGIYFKWDYRIWYLLIIGIVGISLNYGIKLIVNRDRPFESYRWMKETSASFPSSHSCMAMVLYSSLYLIVKNTVFNKIIKRIILISCVSLIIIIPITRIILGVHYFTDVIGGCLVGFFISYLGYIIYLENKIKQKSI